MVEEEPESIPTDLNEEETVKAAVPEIQEVASEPKAELITGQEQADVPEQVSETTTTPIAPELSRVEVASAEDLSKAKATKATTKRRTSSKEDADDPIEIDEFPVEKAELKLLLSNMLLKNQLSL